VDSGVLTQANRGYVIGFTHVPTGKCVKFNAFLTAFSDAYVSDWNSETVYGRMDPIDVYRGTRRNISLSWVAVASDPEEAKKNMSDVGLLIKMLYPTYTAPSLDQNTFGPSIIEKPPLMRMRFSNWVKSMKSTAVAHDAGKSYKPSGDCLSGGLLGHLGGMSFNPNFEPGFFDLNGELFPKEISLSGEFTVLHEHMMGWYRTPSATKGSSYAFGAEAGHNFPYGRASDPSPKDPVATKSPKKNPTKKAGTEKKITK